MTPEEVHDAARMDRWIDDPRPDDAYDERPTPADLEEDRRRDE